MGLKWREHGKLLHPLDFIGIRLQSHQVRPSAPAIVTSPRHPTEPHMTQLPSANDLFGFSACSPVPLNFVHPSPHAPAAWFAVRIREKFRAFAEELFRAQSIEFFSPMITEMRQWSDRRKPVLVPLFGGYVFCRFDPDHQLAILRTLGVIDIVRSGARLCDVDPRELQAVAQALESRQPIEPLPGLTTGQRVRVRSGPLLNVEGVLMESRSHCKLVIGVSMMNRSIAVQVERSQVEPV